jgi:biopolymer transport protein ExbB
MLALALATLWFSPLAIAQEPAAEAPQTASKGNVLEQFWVGLGPMYFVIFLIMSMILVALVVRAILAVQKANFVPEDLVQGIEASLAENNPQAAAELVKADESFLGNLLNAGLGQLTKGKEAVLEAMQAAGDSETMRVEQLIGYIALIGNIAPMVGLLGTVQGMVTSFGVIASSPQTPKPSALAGGIEQALYTTLVGLWLAIPAIVIYNILRNIVQKQIFHAGTKSEELIEKFQEIAK